jgi:hypothetical protein
MWKVKRMNTARIVVLTAADGASGIAAYLANRSDKPLSAKPMAQPPAMDALGAKHEAVIANGADLMAAVLMAGIPIPSLTKTLQ